MVSEELKFREYTLKKSETNSLEIYCIELKSKNKPVLLVIMYRPPNQPLHIRPQDLKIVFSKLKVEKRPVVICTDHNLDLLKASTHNKMQEFLELASDSGFLCTISKPTRITHQSATLIDNIFISKEFCTGYKSMILIDDISDHMPCLTSLLKIEVD